MQCGKMSVTVDSDRRTWQMLTGMCGGSAHLSAGRVHPFSFESVLANTKTAKSDCIDRQIIRFRIASIDTAHK
jgi:hypothetical protein